MPEPTEPSTAPPLSEEDLAARAALTGAAGLLLGGLLLGARSGLFAELAKLGAELLKPRNSDPSVPPSATSSAEGGTTPSVEAIPIPAHPWISPAGTAPAPQVVPPRAPELPESALIAPHGVSHVEYPAPCPVPPAPELVIPVSALGGGSLWIASFVATAVAPPPIRLPFDLPGGGSLWIEAFRTRALPHPPIILPSSALGGGSLWIDTFCSRALPPPLLRLPASVLGGGSLWLAAFRDRALPPPLFTALEGAGSLWIPESAARLLPAGWQPAPPKLVLLPLPDQAVIWNLPPPVQLPSAPVLPVVPAGSGESTCESSAEISIPDPAPSLPSLPALPVEAWWSAEEPAPVPLAPLEYLPSDADLTGLADVAPSEVQRTEAADPDLIWKLAADDAVPPPVPAASDNSATEAPDLSFLPAPVSTDFVDGIPDPLPAPVQPTEAEISRAPVHCESAMQPEPENLPTPDLPESREISAPEQFLPDPEPIAEDFPPEPIPPPEIKAAPAALPAPAPVPPPSHLFVPLGSPAPAPLLPIDFLPIVSKSPPAPIPPPEPVLPPLVRLTPAALPDQVPTPVPPPYPPAVQAASVRPRAPEPIPPPPLAIPLGMAPAPEPIPPPSVPVLPLIPAAPRAPEPVAPPARPFASQDSLIPEPLPLPVLPPIPVQPLAPAHVPPPAPVPIPPPQAVHVQAVPVGIGSPFSARPPGLSRSTDPAVASFLEGPAAAEDSTPHGIREVSLSARRRAVTAAAEISVPAAAPAPIPPPAPPASAPAEPQAVSVPVTVWKDIPPTARVATPPSRPLPIAFGPTAAPKRNSQSRRRQIGGLLLIAGVFSGAWIFRTPIKESLDGFMTGRPRDQAKAEVPPPELPPIVLKAIDPAGTPEPTAATAIPDNSAAADPSAAVSLPATAVASVTPPPEPPSSESPLADPVAAAAQATLDKMLRATTADEIVPIAVNGEALRPRITEWLRSISTSPREIWRISLETTNRDREAGKRSFLFRIVTPEHRMGFPAVVEQTDTGFLVDWDACIQCRDRLLQRYLNDPSAEGMAFYAMLKRTHYFGKDKIDEKELDKNIILKVTSPNPEDEGGYVFVPKTSPLARFVDARFAWNTAYYPVIELARRNGRIELARVVRETWRGPSPGTTAAATGTTPDSE